jgi:hypothetical protein
MGCLALLVHYLEVRRRFRETVERRTCGLDVPGCRYRAVDGF